MCGYFNVRVFECVGFLCEVVCIYGFCNVRACVCVGFEM